MNFALIGELKKSRVCVFGLNLFPTFVGRNPYMNGIVYQIYNQAYIIVKNMERIFGIAVKEVVASCYTKNSINIMSGYAVFVEEPVAGKLEFRNFKI